MKESVIVVKWEGSTEALVAAVNRFAKSETQINHITVLGIQNVQT